MVSLANIHHQTLHQKSSAESIQPRKQNGVKFLIDVKRSGLAPEKEPSWYKILNPIFSEKNESLHLVIGSHDLSLNLQNDSIDSDFESRLTDNENNFQKESLNEEGEQNVILRAPIETSVNGNKKLTVAPHRKKKHCQIEKSSPFKNC